MDKAASIIAQWRQCHVGSLMSHPVQVVSESADLATVEQTFLEHKIRHLPVVDEERRIVGVISQRDLYRAVSPTRDDNGPAALTPGLLVEDREHYYDKQHLHDFELCNVMHDQPEVLFAEDPLVQALQIFVSRRIGCIPIIDNRREVVGILTRHDILKFFGSALNAPAHPQN